MSAVVFLQDWQEKHAPAAMPQLRLALVDSTVYIDVVQQTSEVPDIWERVAGVAVPWNALGYALYALAHANAGHEPTSPEPASEAA